MYVKEQFLRSHEMAQKKGPNTPARFISTWMYVREQFLRSHEKRPKYAGPIYFHADVCQRTIFEIARNGTKKVPNTPARFISTRMYVREQFLRSHKMARKKAQIRRPDLFPRGCMWKGIF